MKIAKINQLRYILSSHRLYLEEFVFDGVKNSQIDKEIDGFFFVFLSAIEGLEKKEENAESKIRYILSSHICFLEKNFSTIMEKKEVSGFSDICSTIIDGH